jgi:hypothetical protein
MSKKMPILADFYRCNFKSREKGKIKEKKKGNGQ